MRSYLTYVLGIVALSLLLGALGFHAFESGINPNVDSFGDSIWWAMVTMATVGYGDIVPVTVGGRVFGGVMMFVGIGTLGVSTAAIAAYLIRLDRLDALRIRGLRGHVVVCGLGSAGHLLAHAFRNDGHQVLVIEKDEGNPHLTSARDAGAAVLIGDAARVETLQRARLDRAKHLVVVCGSDGNNIEITAQARTFARSSAGGRLSCSTQILDPELWYALRTWELASGDAIRLQFFNVSELGARALLARFPAFGAPASAESSAAPHILLVGAGPLGQHVVRHLVRQWNDVAADDAPPLRLTLVDPNAEQVHEQLQHRHPELNTIASFTALKMDLRSAQFQRAAFLFDEHGRCTVTRAYVCVDDEGVGLSAALLLLNHLRRHGVPVVVRVNRRTDLASLLSGLQIFSLLEEAYQPELVLRGTNEILARALHQEYVAQQPPDRARSVVTGWDDLPLEMRESNRTQADSIAHKLESIGCHIVPRTALESDDFAFTPEEVERLAVMEHDRWVTERRALGWTIGPRDPERKTNPNLVPWSELTDEVREMNRNSVRQLPVFLNRAGFTAHRSQA